MEKLTKTCKKGHEYDADRNICPVCKKEYDAKYRIKNSEKIKERRAEWVDRNSDKLAEYYAEYQKNNSIKIAKYKKEWRNSNLTRIKKQGVEKRKNNKEHKKKYDENYYQLNKEYRKAYVKKWKEENKEHVVDWKYKNKEKTNERVRKYTASRSATDKLFKFKRNIRSAICSSFKRRNLTKPCKTSEILGCSLVEAMEHLIKTAIRNYGSYNSSVQWHIDHIIPLSTATTEAEVIKLCNISNLQYLTKDHNLAKKDKLDFKLDSKPETR